jgi:predicted HTH domain antitoxin
MTTVSIDFPESVFSALRRSPKEFAGELRLAAAVHWFQRKEISVERAAEVAGLNRRDFLRALAARGLDVMNIDAEDLRDELRGA